MGRERRGTLRLVVVGVAAFILGSAAVAVGVGGIPGTDGVIHGCYSAQTGALRVVPQGEDCRRNEIPLTWSQTGPTGATGPSGIPGASGAPGPVGPSGASGAAGPSGAQGPSGAAGPSGVSGPSGAPGPSGPPGPSSPPAAMSIAGLAGLPCTVDGVAGVTAVSFDASRTLVVTCEAAATATPVPTPTPTPTPTCTDDLPGSTIRDLGVIRGDAGSDVVGSDAALCNGDTDTFTFVVSESSDADLYLSSRMTVTTVSTVQVCAYAFSVGGPPIACSTGSGTVVIDAAAEDDWWGEDDTSRLYVSVHHVSGPAGPYRLEIRGNVDTGVRNYNP